MATRQQMEPSPVKEYRIALRSGADLTNPEHYERASLRLQRAIRKARLLSKTNSNVMLFGIRMDGSKFPISIRPRGER